MVNGYFITGTDTDSGKTVITLGLMQRLQSRGLQVAGLKPVAAGAEQTDAGLRNGDAQQLLAQASRPVAYDLVNPYCFAPPIAPHLAAQRLGQSIDFAEINRCYGQLAVAADRVLVEGAGGWRVPLGAGRTMADLAVTLNLPVILVVGLRLGCINHALLSAESIRASGLPLAGWVGNQVDPAMAELDANVATLRSWLEAPCLGVIPHLASPTPLATADHLQLPDLF
ncbi:dethiobiotin synthase [Sedimenticola thiotaurini]|uniref:ATP-dependent dethiobiotin synthetase BioD n=1 Tax=Sedimenticola thiotaurini TaxID=1543721 RepID=A0A0F7K0L1_9GAMM|nr:dethiobiotin synthase [Sedimenticola thiotaurini]AKH20685.1 dethiobiotin synthetase [Sedimenticola thiotaurini]